MSALVVTSPVLAATTTLNADSWNPSDQANPGVDWIAAWPDPAPLGPSEAVTVCTGTGNPGAWINFGFPAAGLPAGDLATKVEVRVKYRAVADRQVQLTVGGALVGDVLAVPADFSGASNCDSTSFSPLIGDGAFWNSGASTADLNAGTVGFRFTHTGVGTSNIDAVELVITHFPGGNTPPTAEANGPYSVDEGSSVALSSAGSSDAQDGPGSLTYEWDLDNNGSYETPGASPSFSAAAIDGPDSRTVGLRVTDTGGLSATDTATVNINNVAPSIDTLIVSAPSINEGESVTVSGTFTDPGPGEIYTASAAWSDGIPATVDVVGNTFSTTRTFLDDDPTATPSDVFTLDNVVISDGTEGSVPGTSPEVTVDNVDPTIDSIVFSPDPSDEAEAMSAMATFSDVGSEDTHSCTVDYGDGPVAGVVDQGAGTCTGPVHIYGDNGMFPVTIVVTDDDTGSGEHTESHEVENLDPTVTIDLTGAVDLPGTCDAFFGIVGVEQDHDASGSDPGSDDLKFQWTFPPSSNMSMETYFNNGAFEDPANSPDGNFPFPAEDNATVTFDAPGLYSVVIDLDDDDGRSANDSHPKIVVDNTQCTRSQGFWRHQFKGKGKQHIDNTTLQAYLDVIDCASSVFSEHPDAQAASLADAADRFAPSGSKFDKAVRQTLAAWLNFAAGAVAWDEPIDLDGDAAPDTTFSVLIAEVEAILNDPLATHADLVLAKSLAEVVNLLDEGDETCDD